VTAPDGNTLWEMPRASGELPGPLSGKGDVHASVVRRPDAGPALKTAASRGPIENSIGMKLKLIPAGEFVMGSPDNDEGAGPEEKPQHKVRISPFYLGIYEVTQAQYKAVMGNTPSSFKGSDDLPVEKVSWLDAVKFCNELGEKEGLKSFYELEAGTARVPDWAGSGYRLPTEAEWEYACRAGSATAFSFGDDIKAPLGDFAWFGGNSEGKTHRVGQKRPNAFGLYDMHGNVWEWCSDWYGGAYYRHSPVDDPPGAGQATHRVMRGGSWFLDPQYARSASRGRRTPEKRIGELGFRVARVQGTR
jgi:formylglycine-generating enzyme required for sulfatase activity